MKKHAGRVVFAAMVAGALVAPACLADINVALNADVTLHGNFFTGGWGSGQVVNASTVVDGVFLPEHTQWDQGAVWWDMRDYSDRRIEIDLGQLCQINGFVVQADDNDPYSLTYWNAQANQWQDAWLVGAVGGWGLITRPNSSDRDQQYLLASPIVTDRLMIGSLGTFGDLYYSVSEVQAFGSPVPLPGAVLLGAIGLSVAGWRLRRQTA